jgi:hypothetical protein
MCHIFRDRTEHMTVQQVEKFILQAKNAGGVNKVKVVGGEPLMHPNFLEIYDLLIKAGKDGIIKLIKIDTNKTLPIPKVEITPFVHWGGKHPSKKRHQPALWSPADMGKTIVPAPCAQVRHCGLSLDKFGYLPCSLAIMMVRLFGLTSLYKRELPSGVWGLEKLCLHCCFSSGAEFGRLHGKMLKDFTEEEKTPTKTYQEALDRFNVEEFYKNTPEF